MEIGSFLVKVRRRLLVRFWLQEAILYSTLVVVSSVGSLVGYNKKCLLMWFQGYCLVCWLQ